MSSAAEKCPSQSFFSRKISRSKTSFPSRRDSGSKEEISQATTREIFPKSDFGPRGQTSYRGRPYDRPCRAWPRNALPNPAFHGKSRAAKPFFLPAGTQGRKRRFLKNIARDVPKSNSKSYFRKVPLSYAFPRESTRLWTVNEISISNPTPRPRGDISYPGRPYDFSCTERPGND